MEALLARVCGPAMAGITPANLVSIDKTKHPHFHTELGNLAANLRPCGICFDVLCEYPSRTLVLVYRPSVLREALQKQGLRSILEDFGYDPDASLATLLSRLRYRLTAREFPHEIGVFLGYPPEDIRGFLYHRREGVLLVGEWKVYGDADNARRLFSRYAACRKSLARRLKNGCTLAEIFHAA